MDNGIKFDALGYYKLFNLDLLSDSEVIKTRYKELVKEWHPDYNSNPNAVEIFQKISVAYNTLKDEDSRLAYILLSMISA